MPNFTSSGPIKFSSIRNYFGGSNKIIASNYYTNNSIKYTYGIVDLPTISSRFPISLFYNKSNMYVTTNKRETNLTISPYNLKPETATYNNTFEILHGCRFTNKTNPNGIQIVNNLNSFTLGSTPAEKIYSGSTNYVILASPGDTIKIEMGIKTDGPSYSEIQTIWVNYGNSGTTTSYTLLTSMTNALSNSIISYDYIVPSNLLPGNYSILCCNKYSSTNYLSVCYYSLQIFNQIPTPVQTYYSGNTYATKPLTGTYNVDPSTSFWLSGCSFTNTTNLKLRTLDNYGTNTASSISAITHFSTLVIQASIGDTIQISYKIFTNGSYVIRQSTYVNYGSGYNMIGTVNVVQSNFNDFIIVTLTYNIPLNIVPGNYMIACCSYFIYYNYLITMYYSLQIF